jgi:hypothetical protein
MAMSTNVAIICFTGPIRKGAIMLILTDNTGVTIKRTIQSVNYARIGVTQTALWVDGVRRAVRDNWNPHCEFTINDCADLLAELETISCQSGYITPDDLASVLKESE